MYYKIHSLAHWQSQRSLNTSKMIIFIKLVFPFKELSKKISNFSSVLSRASWYFKTAGMFLEHHEMFQDIHLF